MDGITLALFSLLFSPVDHWLQLREQRRRPARRRPSPTSPAANAALPAQPALPLQRAQFHPRHDPAGTGARAADRHRALRIPPLFAQRSRTRVDARRGNAGHRELPRDPADPVRGEARGDGAVDPELLGFVLPCFSCIRWWKTRSARHGNKRAAAARRDRGRRPRAGLRIRVSNTAASCPGPAEAGGARDGTGTGLRNVTQRLELAFPDGTRSPSWSRMAGARRDPAATREEDAP